MAVDNSFNKYALWVSMNFQDYIFRGELKATELAEACQDHFGVATESGDTDIEVKIFEFVVDLENNKNVYANDKMMALKQNIWNKK